MVSLYIHMRLSRYLLVLPKSASQPFVKGMAGLCKKNIIFFCHQKYHVHLILQKELTSGRTKIALDNLFVQ